MNNAARQYMLRTEREIDAHGVRPENELAALALIDEFPPDPLDTAQDRESDSLALLWLLSGR